MDFWDYNRNTVSSFVPNVPQCVSILKKNAVKHADMFHLVPNIKIHFDTHVTVLMKVSI
jgi:hypothetical protein